MQCYIHIRIGAAYLEVLIRLSFLLDQIVDLSSHMLCHCDRRGSSINLLISTPVSSAFCIACLKADSIAIARFRTIGQNSACRQTVTARKHTTQGNSPHRGRAHRPLQSSRSWSCKYHDRYNRHDSRIGPTRESTFPRFSTTFLTQNCILSVPLISQ